MRKALAKDEGERKKFTGVFIRIGRKINFKGYSEDTILLSNIIDQQSKEMVTDHCWFSYTKGFEAINLTEGATVEFDARIKEYKKGYVNRGLKINRQKKDFKLSNPTKIKLIHNSDR